MPFDLLSADLLWRYALAAIPVVICVAIVCRVLPCRPATRYSLWLIALLSFLALPHLPVVQVPMPAFLDTADEPATVPTFEPARRAGAGATETPRPAPALTFEPSPEGLSFASSEILEPLVAPTPPAQDGRLRRVPLVEPAESKKSDLHRWKTQLTAVRDAVMGLPPIPTTIWTGGIALLVGVVCVRMVRSRRLISRARMAPSDVSRMVAEESSRMKLRRPPTTLMVDARISPMVWCGRTPRLLLPATLWMQLDDLGRRSVILHELAHLRRRDHWVCWLEMIVGCLYWWHPVVWWIRRRMRDEADLCCDAWVTALLPVSRRHYAQALLNTRAYVSDLRPAAPVVGLGVTTVRAKRFARRLTMVMTDPSDHGAAKLSIRGLALAATIAVGAYLVTPVLACPPTPKDAAKSRPDKPDKRFTYTVPKAPKPLKAPKLPRAASRPATPPTPATAPEEAETTFEQFMRNRGGDVGGVEERIERLEQQLERLYDRLERLMNQRRRGMNPPVALPEVAVPRPTPPSVSPMPAPAPLAYDQKSGQNQGVVQKSYKLPRGKLKALTQLMARGDVPILVEPKCETLRVHATPQQHMVFESFCEMINRNDREQSKEYRLSQGKLDALTKLMVRSDVPILVEPKCKSLRVHGNAHEQAVFSAFCQMINTDGGVPAQKNLYYAQGQAEQGPCNELLQMATAYQHQAMQEIQQRQSLESVLQGLHAQIDALHQQADALRNQGDSYRHQSDDLETQVDELDEQAEHLERSERSSVRQQMSVIRVQGKSLQRQADQMDRQADRVERQAERLEGQVEDIEARLEELDSEEG